MFVKSFAPLLLATLAAAAALPRDANSILSSLQTLSKDIATLNNTLSTFQGGGAAIFQALQIQGEAQQLVTDVNNAKSASSSSAALDDAGSRSVAFQVVSISTQIYQVLDLLISKHAAFEATLSGSSALVENDLQQLKNGTDSFGSALTPKFVPAVQKLAPLLVSNIDYHFVQAIKVYNSTS
jgi:hypothetical protein